MSRPVSRDRVLRKGLLRTELYLGDVAGVSASKAIIQLNTQSTSRASHVDSYRYGRGEVGEMVLIEGQVNLVLGRLIDVRAPSVVRDEEPNQMTRSEFDRATGFVQFLGTVRSDTLSVSAGVETYPRLGDRVYVAPLEFVGQIALRLDRYEDTDSLITMSVGTVSGQRATEIRLRPEKVFGRHCAVLGATGGGKSWTVARLIEEAARHSARVVLLDATGEYRSLSGPHVSHCHAGEPRDRAEGSVECSIPPDGFLESDFIAMFEPSGKVQGPKLREAIMSLRLVQLEPGLADDGLLKKAGKARRQIDDRLKFRSKEIERPNARFDATKLARQLMEECVWPEGGSRTNPNPEVFGGYNDSDKTYCLPLGTRIHALLNSKSFAPVFKSNAKSLNTAFSEFWNDPTKKLLRVCLGGLSYEFRAREFIVNTIGRMLLIEAREGRFGSTPLVVFLDEAHNFLGRSIGNEDSSVRLDSFEMIAREGRKHGLNICLATQRPRDLTEGVLSQMGTLIVHRLTNDHDREIVERACGEIDRSASAFLANLRQGEAAIIGVDFPIPLTVQVTPPTQRPCSDGADYQRAWRAKKDDIGVPSIRDPAGAVGTSSSAPCLER